MSRKVRIMLALVMLTLFLGSGAAHALPSEGRNADRGPGMLVAVWEWAASLLEGRVSFFQVTAAAGGTVQPPPPSTQGTSGGDGGGYIDPNGQH
ncbi:MAG TPA: hypothetical protein VNM67_04700 [Thermoanaerobaculia bacterium]|jgi:hypothetical protein|nr:hypothetical protein [Thermoanaerobaculia bacterium]